MALQANSTDVYRGGVLVEAPALPKGPKASLTLRREARLAYTILTPTLLVILFVVAYPFCTAIYMSMQDKMVGAPGGSSGSRTTPSWSATRCSFAPPGTAWSTRSSPSASSSSSASPWR